MALKCKFKKKTFDVSDIWIDKESFKDISQKEMIDLANEDPIYFLDDIGFWDNIEFYWED